MADLIRLVFGLIVDLFRSRAALEAEILVLRQQIIVLRRRKATRLPFTATDRLVLGWACRLFPKTCGALAIVRPETVVRWHRQAFGLTGAGSRDAGGDVPPRQPRSASWSER